MDCLLKRTVHQGMPGMCVKYEKDFTDLDFADDAALLAEMLDVLILALTVIHTFIHLLNMHNAGRSGVVWSSDKLVQKHDPPERVNKVENINSGQGWVC